MKLYLIKINSKVIIFFLYKNYSKKKIKFYKLKDF